MSPSARSSSEVGRRSRFWKLWRSACRRWSSPMRSAVWLFATPITSGFRTRTSSRLQQRSIGCYAIASSPLAWGGPVANTWSGITTGRNSQASSRLRCSASLGGRLTARGRQQRVGGDKASGAERLFHDVVIRDREHVVEDREPLVELLPRDRQRGGDHDH